MKAKFLYVEAAYTAVSSNNFKMLNIFRRICVYAISTKKYLTSYISVE